MFGRGWWIAGIGGIAAVALLIALSAKGPASGRAPSQTGAHEPRAGEPGTDGEASAAVRFSIAVLPLGSRPKWRLEVRAGAGQPRTEEGAGEREWVMGALPRGRALVTLRAPGFVGETRRVEFEAGAETPLRLVLRQFGRVSGSLRCDGLPVGGALVRLVMPVESRSILMDLAPEDRMPETGWSVESDAAGRYSFDRALPASGYTLVAADFDHAPSRAGPFDLEPGQEATVDITLVEAAHLSGTIVDSRGNPCPGATVHVYEQQKKPSFVGWMDEARARTDEDGRFVTPALPGTGRRMLKAWVAFDGVQEIIQHETEPPERGTKDVGTLAPLPGVVLFESESAAKTGRCSLTVVVNGDPPGVGQSIIVNGITFDRDGRARVMGFPVGEGLYTVSNADQRAVAHGQFRTTGRDIVVKIPPFGEPAPEPPEPKEKLVVDVADTGEPALVVLLADGDFVMWRQVEKQRAPVVERVPPGRYLLHVSAGDRYAQREITQVEGQDLNVTIAPDLPGRTVTVFVLQDGKPVPGARLQIRGFRGGARGLRAPWAVAGDDGRARLRALPPEVTVLTITALNSEGYGRTYPIDVTAAEEVTVDLAKPPEQGR